MASSSFATTMHHELDPVSDAQHRELRFEYYANGRLATIRGPGKIGVRYIYSDSGNLEQAIGTDGIARRYSYEDERHPHHLTGLAIGYVSSRRPTASATSSSRVATWAYDEQGRAVFSSHPDDAGKVTLDVRRWLHGCGRRIRSSDALHDRLARWCCLRERSARAWLRPLQPSRCALCV